MTYTSSFVGTGGSGRQAALDMFTAQEQWNVSAVLGPFTSTETLHSASVSTVSLLNAVLQAHKVAAPVRESESPLFIIYGTGTACVYVLMLACCSSSFQ